MDELGPASSVSAAILSDASMAASTASSATTGSSGHFPDMADLLLTRVITKITPYFIHLRVDDDTRAHHVCVDKGEQEEMAQMAEAGVRERALRLER